MSNMISYRIHKRHESIIYLDLSAVNMFAYKKNLNIPFKY